jgi:hypothetical protein
MSLFISSVFTYDEDAGNYIQAVEGASGDNQALEPATRKAINNFVIGCKQDGIWTAIKASCILAGARTLAGALRPLVGTAPTNVGGLFVSGDYTRKTGLVGNGTSKYLNSNRNSNSDPQNNKHLAVYASESGSTGLHIGANDSDYSYLGVTAATLNVISTDFVAIAAAPYVGFSGGNRSINTAFTARANGTTVTKTATSVTPSSFSTYVFCRNTSGTAATFSGARLAFYSIGEALDLARLDARVTDLINAFAVTIP